MQVKFEVRIFNRFGAISIQFPFETGLIDRSAAHTHRHTHSLRQTHIERTHYLRHSLRSLGGDNNALNGFMRAAL